MAACRARPCIERQARRLVQRIRNSHHLGATRKGEFRFKSCTSKLLFLAWFSNFKFLLRACHPCDRDFKFTTLGLRRAGRRAIGIGREQGAVDPGSWPSRTCSPDPARRVTTPVAAVPIYKTRAEGSAIVERRNRPISDIRQRSVARALLTQAGMSGGSCRRSRSSSYDRCAFANSS